MNSLRKVLAQLRHSVPPRVSRPLTFPAQLLTAALACGGARCQGAEWETTPHAEAAPCGQPRARNQAGLSSSSRSVRRLVLEGGPLPSPFRMRT